jgi:ethanolamine utilization protein EutQ (cupin superfamily)
MHVHAVDQIFYILSGTMSIEVEGKRYDCPPGSLIIFPAGCGTVTGTAAASRPFTSWQLNENRQIAGVV